MNHYKSNIMRLSFAILVFIFEGLTSTLASNSLGSIDAVNKVTRVCQDQACATYGQVNFKPTLIIGVNPIVISDTSITGHAWGDQIGWINLTPTGLAPTDVLKVNPSTGVITGKAYANTGSWINFSPTGAGVTLVDNGSGSDFSGWAWVSGNYGGWMRFDCTIPATCIKTDWRKASMRAPVIPVVTPPVQGGLLPVGNVILPKETPKNENKKPATNDTVKEIDRNNAGLDSGDTSTSNLTNSNIGALGEGETGDTNNAEETPDINPDDNTGDRVVEVLPLTPEFPVINNNVPLFRKLFPTFSSTYSYEYCYFCILVRKDEGLTYSTEGDIKSVPDRIMIKYGFISDDFEYGVEIKKDDKVIVNVDVYSAIISFVLLLILIRIIRRVI